jgi:hypothetical protein
MSLRRVAVALAPPHHHAIEFKRIRERERRERPRHVQSTWHNDASYSTTVPRRRCVRHKVIRRHDSLLFFDALATDPPLRRGANLAAHCRRVPPAMSSRAFLQIGGSRRLTCR